MRLGTSYVWCWLRAHSGVACMSGPGSDYRSITDANPIHFHSGSSEPWGNAIQLRSPPTDQVLDKHPRLRSTAPVRVDIRRSLDPGLRRMSESLKEALGKARGLDSSPLLTPVLRHKRSSPQHGRRSPVSRPNDDAPLPWLMLHHRLRATRQYDRH
ncbi:hypothetical protein B0I37DRAFT_146168 [Chaetomium sp. MPI-CAGE-AT-0009]|nr:hypothetical protein B0I37DRAFT_146168 [Chaetomium sp. MPI-CAGE-AT-0009]